MAQLTGDNGMWKRLTLVAATLSTACYVAKRASRARASRRRAQKSQDVCRWENEGGASRSGAATSSLPKAAR